MDDARRAQEAAEARMRQAEADAADAARREREEARQKELEELQVRGREALILVPLKYCPSLTVGALTYVAVALLC